MVFCLLCDFWHQHCMGSVVCSLLLCKLGACSLAELPSLWHSGLALCCDVMMKVRDQSQVLDSVRLAGCLKDTVYVSRLYHCKT